MSSTHQNADLDMYTDPMAHYDGVEAAATKETALLIVKLMKEGKSGAELCSLVNASRPYEDSFEYDEGWSRIHEKITDWSTPVPEEETCNDTVYFHGDTFVLGQNNPSKRVKLDDAAESDNKAESDEDDSDDAAGSDEEDDSERFYKFPFSKDEHNKYHHLLTRDAADEENIQETMRDACGQCGFESNGLIIVANDSDYPGFAELRYMGMQGLDMSWLVPISLLAAFPEEMLVNNTRGLSANPLEV